MRFNYVYLVTSVFLLSACGDQFEKEDSGKTLEIQAQANIKTLTASELNSKIQTLGIEGQEPLIFENVEDFVFDQDIVLNGRDFKLTAKRVFSSSQQILSFDEPAAYGERAKNGPTIEIVAEELQGTLIINASGQQGYTGKHKLQGEGRLERFCYNPPIEDYQYNAIPWLSHPFLGEKGGDGADGGTIRVQISNLKPELIKAWADGGGGGERAPSYQELNRNHDFTECDKSERSDKCRNTRVPRFCPDPRDQRKIAGILGAKGLPGKVELL